MFICLVIDNRTLPVAEHWSHSSNPSSKISQLGFISGSSTSEVNILALGLLLSGHSVFLGEGLDEEQKIGFSFL